MLCSRICSKQASMQKLQMVEYNIFWQFLRRLLTAVVTWSSKRKKAYNFAHNFNYKPRFAALCQAPPNL